MYFVSIYENRRMKPVEIVTRIGEEGSQRMMGRVNLRYIVSAYVNITIYPPAQLLYANKTFIKNNLDLHNITSEVYETLKYRSPTLSKEEDIFQFERPVLS
jgi:hypothetical protein